MPRKKSTKGKLENVRTQSESDHIQKPSMEDIANQYEDLLALHLSVFKEDAQMLKQES